MYLSYFGGLGNVVLIIKSVSNNHWRSVTVSRPKSFNDLGSCSHIPVCNSFLVMWWWLIILTYSRSVRIILSIYLELSQLGPAVY